MYWVLDKILHLQRDGEVSKKSLRIWRGYYDYHRHFIKDLRREILQELESMQNYDVPNWVIVTGKLEKVFGH